VRWIGDRGEVSSGGRLNEGLEGLAKALTEAECLPVEASRTSMPPLAVHVPKPGQSGASLTKHAHPGLVLC
jgi:hypothetical protein